MEKYLTFIIWIFIFGITYYFNENNKKTDRHREEKVKIIIIILLVYYIIYFLSGILFGFSKSPYSLKFTELFKNLVLILGLRMLQEYSRSIWINNKKDILWAVILTIAFSAIQIDFTKIGMTEEGFKYVLEIVLPIIIESAFLTYLSWNGGYILNFAYIIPSVLVTILSPIFPDIERILEVSFKYIMYFLMYLFINFETATRIQKITKKQMRRENPIKLIPIVCFVILIVCFVSGAFNYRPVSIISNSMYPEFSRGDILIIKKIDKEEIKKGDIIQYQLNKHFVVHRVAEIHVINQNEKQYITKGDNNLTNDLLPVSEEQILGIVKYKIPYLGYPSVWFSEIFLKGDNDDFI